MPRKKKARKRKKGNHSPRRGHRRRAEPALPAGFSTPVIEHFQLPNPLSGLTDAQCRELFGTMGREAAKDFVEAFKELESRVRAHDPAELLATAAFYCLLKGTGPGTDYTDEGPYSQAVIEVLQSVCLRFLPEQFGTTPVLHGYLFAILDAAERCSRAFAKQRLAAFEAADPADRHLLLTVEGARLHTQLMRNWGYPQHMRLITRRLFEPLEAGMAKATGAGATLLLTLFDAARDIICRRATGLLNTLGGALRPRSLPAMVRAFCKLAGTTGEDERRILELMRSGTGPIEQKRFFLLSYFHQCLPAVFTVMLDEWLRAVPGNPDRMKVRAVLDSISFPLGTLAAEKPEHLLMQSKISTRPLIKVADESYFVPILGLLNSFSIEIVETPIRADAELKTRYHKRRAAFLEEELLRLLRDAFPGCPVHAGTTGISPVDGRQFENDCLVVIGPLALVFEAKSERVDDVARRGGTGTLRDHYESLVQEPAQQAERFARILEQGRGRHTFQTRKSGSYELDLSPIRRAICIAVTLDWFPSPTLCWQQLLKSNLVGPQARPAISLSLADLMVVLEVLETPAVRLHYFWRRIEWEAHVDYFADEEDLLVYYLSEGLVIPECVRATGSPMQLYGNSRQLHRHYMAAWVDPETAAPRPRRICTRWWSSLLRRVEANPLAAKWDIACVLLDLSFRQQQEFERRLAGVIRNVRRDGNECGENALVFFGRASESNGALVAFAYRNLSQQERNARAADLAGKVQAEHGAKRVVVMGRDIDRCGDPYDFLAYTDAPPAGAEER